MDLSFIEDAITCTSFHISCAMYLFRYRMCYRRCCYALHTEEQGKFRLSLFLPPPESSPSLSSLLYCSFQLIVFSFTSYLHFHHPLPPFPSRESLFCRFIRTSNSSPVLNSCYAFLSSGMLHIYALLLPVPLLLLLLSSLRRRTMGIGTVHAQLNT